VIGIRCPAVSGAPDFFAVFAGDTTSSYFALQIAVSALQVPFIKASADAEQGRSSGGGKPFRSLRDRAGIG
jgi:hypothetical protein